MISTNRHTNTKVPAATIAKLLTVQILNINTIVIDSDKIADLGRLHAISHYVHPQYIRSSILIHKKHICLAMIEKLVLSENIQISGQYIKFFNMAQKEYLAKSYNKYLAMLYKNKIAMLRVAHTEISTIATDMKALMNSKNHIVILYDFIAILLKSNLFKLVDLPLSQLFGQFFLVSRKIFNLIFFMNKLEGIAIAKSIGVGISGTSDVLSVKKYIKAIKSYVDATYISNIIRFIEKLADKYNIDWDTTILNNRISKMCLSGDMPMLDLYVDDISHKLKILYNAPMIKESGLYSALSRLEKGLKKYKESNGKNMPAWIKILARSYYIPTIIHGINYLFKYYYLNQLSAQSVDALKDFLTNILKNLDKVYI